MPSLPKYLDRRLILQALTVVIGLNAPHREQAQAHKEAITKAQQKLIEREHGCRYSVLLELDVVRFSVIDPMHNLLLGTAKHVLSVWTSLDKTVYKRRLIHLLHPLKFAVFLQRLLRVFQVLQPINGDSYLFTVQGIIPPSSLKYYVNAKLL